MIQQQEYGKEGVMTMGLSSIAMVRCTPMLIRMAAWTLKAPEATAMWAAMVTRAAASGSFVLSLIVYKLSI